MTLLKDNAATIQKELNWLKQLLERRLQLCMEEDEKQLQQLEQISPPDLSGNASLYAETIRKHQMGWQERAVLALALAAQLNPSLLDIFLIKSDRTQSFFSVFGGILINNNSRFIPTMQTAIFMLGGLNLTEKIKILLLFEPDHYLYTHELLTYQDIQQTEPPHNRILILTPEFFRLITTGKVLKPEYNQHFPAQNIHTELDWEDLVLDYDTYEALDELKAWLKHGAALMEDDELRKKVKKGYRCLFYGPPGTGKTLTACLLGKTEGIDVYRIDLSQIVSKYIGETEKNLKNIFDKAEHKKWLLFFDEAEALFGKRTQTSNAHDRFANQEVSYLLQRIEDFNGLVILSTNLKANMDDAFTRRFQSMIYFPMPDKETRLLLWQKAFSKKYSLETTVDLPDIAKKYELSGGSIINIVRYCTLMALQRDDHKILNDDLLKGIRREFKKEGKSIG